jgi:hypothetical protein
MTSPIVHIGYHKTATNWFQRSFYPAVANYCYVSRKTVRRVFLLPHALLFDPDSAGRTLAGLSRLPLILCEEELSGNIHTGGHWGCLSRDVARRLHSTLPNARIVVFIRNQVDMIASVYMQYIKEGGTHSPSRYLFPQNHLPPSGFSPYHTPLFSFDHFRYLPLISWYQRLFGEDQVHVYPYEAFRADNRGFVRELAQTFELQADLSAIDFSSPNRAYRVAVLALARLINRFTYQDVPDKRYFFHIPLLYKNSRKILKHLNKRAGAGPPVTPETLLGPGLVDHIKTCYQADNKRLARRLGLPLSGWGYF